MDKSNMIRSAIVQSNRSRSTCIRRLNDHMQSQLHLMKNASHPQINSIEKPDDFEEIKDSLPS